MCGINILIFFPCSSNSINENTLKTHIIQGIEKHGMKNKKDNNVRGSPHLWGYVHQNVSHASDIHFIKKGYNYAAHNSVSKDTSQIKYYTPI